MKVLPALATVAMQGAGQRTNYTLRIAEQRKERKQLPEDNSTLLHLQTSRSPLLIQPL
jgi:hypothetical protein